MSYSAVDKDERFNSITAKKTLNLPVVRDIMTNLTNVSFNEGSVIYDQVDESLYYGNGSTLLKVINEDENGTVIFDGDTIFNGDTNTFNHDIIVNGTSTFNDNTTFNGATNTFTNDITVGGTSTLNELIVNGTSTFNDNTTFNGATNTFTNDIVVNGTSTFNDNTTFNGDINTVNKSLRATLLGFNDNGIIDIYVDAINGDDANIGTDPAFPKKTIVDAINSVGARPNSRINLEPAPATHYTLDGNDPTLYSNSIENRLYIRGDPAATLYEVTSTFTVDSTSDLLLDVATGLEVTSVTINSTGAPSSFGLQWVRFNGNYYPIIDGVANTSLTILSDIAPFIGTTVEVVQPLINLDLNNLDQVLGDLFISDMNVFSSFSTFSIAQNVGIMRFTRVALSIGSSTTGLDVGNGGTLEFNYSFVRNTNSSLTTTLTNSGRINLNRSYFSGYDVISDRGTITNSYSKCVFNNIMNSKSIYKSVGGLHDGGIDMEFSSLICTGWVLNTGGLPFYLKHSDFYFSDVGDLTNNITTGKNFYFETSNVDININSDVTFTGTADSTPDTLAALIYFKYYCRAVIQGSVTINYSASTFANSYIAIDQFSKLELKPSAFIDNIVGNPRSVFFMNIMSDLIINSVVTSAPNFNGSSPAGSKLQIGTNPVAKYIGGYPSQDNYFFDIQTGGASTNVVLLPGSDAVAGPVQSQGSFCRVLTIQ